MIVISFCVPLSHHGILMAGLIVFIPDIDSFLIHDITVIHLLDRIVIFKSHFRRIRKDIISKILHGRSRHIVITERIHQGA